MTTAVATTFTATMQRSPAPRSAEFFGTRGLVDPSARHGRFAR